MLIWFLDGHQVKVNDAVVNKNRSREVTTDDDDTTRHISDGKATSETCRVQVKITGMSCSSCVNKIESSLSSKRGKISLAIYF